jgi:hypothetical protein
MGHMKKLIGLCVGLMMILIGSIAVAHDGGGGETKVINGQTPGPLSTRISISIIRI